MVRTAFGVAAIALLLACGADETQTAAEEALPAVETTDVAADAASAEETSAEAEDIAVPAVETTEEAEEDSGEDEILAGDETAGKAHLADAKKADAKLLDRILRGFVERSKSSSIRRIFDEARVIEEFGLPK